MPKSKKYNVWYGSKTLCVGGTEFRNRYIVTYVLFEDLEFIPGCAGSGVIGCGSGPPQHARNIKNHHLPCFARFAVHEQGNRDKSQM